LSKKQRIIYGFRGIIDFLQSGKTLEQIFIADDVPQDSYAGLMAVATASATPVLFVSRSRLSQQFGSLANYDALGIVSKIPFVSSRELIDRLAGQGKNSGKLPLVLALDGVTDPGNVGTIIRTLAAANATGLISDNSCVVTNNRLMRNSSAGAIFNFTIARTSNLLADLEYAKQAGIKIYATSSHKFGKNIMLYEADFRIPVIVVAGSEERGVSREVLEIADSLITIPQTKAVESLNVAVASAIVAYEAVRQNLQNQTRPGL